MKNQKNSLYEHNQSSLCKIQSWLPYSYEYLYFFKLFFTKGFTTAKEDWKRYSVSQGENINKILLEKMQVRNKGIPIKEMLD